MSVTQTYEFFLGISKYALGKMKFNVQLHHNNRYDIQITLIDLYLLIDIGLSLNPSFSPQPIRGGGY